MVSRLDLLLEEGLEGKKITKQFSISEEVAEALEKLRPGVRSKFVDLALRTILEEKNLIDKKKA